MFHSPPRSRRLVALFALLIVAIATIFAFRSPTVASAVQTDPITAALAKVRAAGSHHFSSDMTQVTIPLATVTNVGRSSRTQQLHMEGNNNLLAQSMEMQILSGEGNLLQRANGVTIRAEKGKTLARRQGGEWEEIDSVSDAIAPQGDFFAYLAALHTVQAHPSETRNGITLTRYSFEIDSPRLARYIQHQMEATLRAKGELLPTMQLEVPTYFRDMVGSGELWIGTDGLPLRQILDLQFPPQGNEQVHAQIVVDFSQFSTPQPTPLELLKKGDGRALLTTLLISLPDTKPLWIGLPFLAFAILLIVYRRSRMLYNAVVIAVILSMVVGPLLSNYSQIKFLDVQTAKAAERKSQQDASDKQLELREALGKVEFNPHLNPLETAKDRQPERANQIPAASLQSAPRALAVTPPAGMTNWWPGDSNATDTVGGKNGTLNGSATYAAGMVGQAFSFNGSNGYVALPDNFFPYPTSGTSTAPFTLELWFKTSSSGVILGQQFDAPYTASTTSGYVPAIYVDTAGKLRIDLFWNNSFAQIVSANAVNNGTFQHLAVVYENGTQTAYLNGVSIGSKAHTQTAYATNYKYQFGTGFTTNWPGGLSGWANFTGLLDEATVYNRTLSQAEVQAIYNAGSDGKSKTFTDSDNDGLSDDQEASIGTRPLMADSDLDGLDDSLEVKGFTFANKKWYLNPNASDSNNDGLGDALEWGLANNGTRLALPQDTDNDGVPDLFDNDNDNDGVPDALDLSPSVKGSTYAAADSLRLSLQNLAAGKPTYVEFQLRPENPKQLWYGFNVLDWPEDGEGQMRDVDGWTFATYAAQQGRSSNSQENSGDMKVIPMLEIRMAANNANLPLAATRTITDITGKLTTRTIYPDLDPLGITVRDLEQSGTNKVVYVPLSLVTDEKTGERVAFSGQMLYLPSGSWSTAHEVRLVWAVQTLNDQPTTQCDGTANPPIIDNCSDDGYIYNVPQVIQSYTTGWSLTGMTVQEERGTTMDIAYGDPTQGSVPARDDAVNALTTVLNSAFVVGRDFNNDGKRDLTADSIAKRFDRTIAPRPSEKERYAILDILRVDTAAYATFDQAMATTAITKTTAILNQMNGIAASDANFKPLLLFAYENQSRSLSLELARANSAYVSQSANNLVFNMSPTGQAAQAVSVLAGIRQVAYCPTPGSPIRWNPCSLDDYSKELDRRYTSILLPGESDQSLTAGRILAAQLSYAAFNSGYVAIVQEEGKIVSGTYSLTTDDLLEASVRYGLQIVGAGAPLLADLAFEKLVEAGEDVTKLLAGLKTYENALIPELFASNIKSILTKITRIKAEAAVGAVGGMVIVLTQFLTFIPNLPVEASGTLYGISTLVTIGLTVVKPIVSLVKEISSGATTLSKALTTVNSLSKVAKVASTIGLVITIGVSWGIFFYTLATSGYSVGSPELNKAFAETVASTVVTIYLFILSLNPIGAVIAAIVGVIDFILTVVCELGVSELRLDGSFYGGACFTLSTSAIKVLSYLIYNYDQMIDTDRKDLVVIGSPQVRLADPNKGFVQGNSISVAMPVTTTAVHKSPDATNGLTINGYLWLFSQDNLRSTTFKYNLSQSEQPLVVARDQMKSAWQNVSVDHYYVATPMYRGLAFSNAQVTGINRPAGLNQTVDVYFNNGYAIPAYECWPVPIPYGPLIIPTPICYTRELVGSNSTKLDAMKFDIFPATLDDFMKMGTKSDGGQGMAWDAAFPSLSDADGDGLMARNRGGIDPNDTTWDSDNDGLSDLYELEHRQAGVNFSLTQRDADGDGLTDLQEAQFNTNPAKADSDNDGLKDGEEVWHQRYDPATGAPTNTWEGGWDVTINGAIPFVVRVSSDPLSADGDSDGISDYDERELARQPLATSRVDLDNRPYHPNVANSIALVVKGDISDRDRFLAANQSFVYTATVVATRPMNAGTLNLTASPVLGSPNPPSPLSLSFSPGTFNQSQQVIAQTNFKVIGNATSQVAVLRAQAQAPLVSNGGVQINSHSLTVTVDNDKPVVQLTSLQANSYVRASKTDLTYLVIGGTASDATSRPELVRVTANDGLGTRVANGTYSWSATVGFRHGFNTINLFARDAVGNEALPPAIEILGDGDAPVGNVLASPTRTVSATRSFDGEWVVKLRGVYNDPAITVGNRSVNGSGVDPQSLRVQLQPSSLNSEQILGAGSWQTATFAAGNQWSLDYLLPSDVSDLPPNAYYEITLCGSDKVGNAGCLAPETWHVDARAPQALMTTTDISSGKLEGTITHTVSIGGVITDPFTLSPGYANLTRVNQLEVSFTPITAVLASTGRVLQLNFEEPKGATYFTDSSGQGNHARCTAPCLATQQPGKSGNGVLADGAGIKIGSHPSLNFNQNAGFSIQAWVKVQSNTTVNRAVRILETTGNNGTYQLGVTDDGTPYFSLYSSNQQFLVGATSFKKLNDNGWHHIMATYDRRYPQLYLDGVYVGGGFVPSTDNTDYSSTSMTIAQRPVNPAFAVLDQIEIFNRPLSDDEVKALALTGNQIWYEATLQQNPSNPVSAMWSLPIPNGLQGIYQIDARGHDLVGNVGPSHNLWRGIIDNVAPSVQMTGWQTGFSVLSNGVRKYETRYTCSASDWQLDASTFNCPGNAFKQPSRSFNTDKILQSRFPTITILSTMTNTWTAWEPKLSGTLTACDAAGRCSTTTPIYTFPPFSVAASTECGVGNAECAVQSETVSVSASEVAAVPSEQPNAEIVNPTDGSFVGSAGNVEVTVAAEAAKTLKEVSVLLDGEVVATMPFARIDKLTVAQQSVSIAMNAGEHTLEARASDWAGNLQPAGTHVRFTLVSKDPTVALGKTNLTLSDTYQAQSGIVLIQGTVDNTENLATVQVKVDDQPYADALVKDGVWGIAYPVIDPENGKLAISVRAIDKAGQITRIGEEASTDFDSGVVPETTITAQPGNGVNASIGFSGTVNGEVAVAFECKLDEGAFVPCTTPVEYKELSNGEHSFQVHAINGQGTQDPSPAQVKWTVSGGGIVTQIGNMPDAETTSRSASFELSGGNDYECSLDGAAFAVCSSPATYNGLSDGTHTFQVRVKGNPASKYTWRVENIAPVATDMTLSTLQNVNLPVTLQAKDESTLSYIIVGKPANGTLNGEAPNLVYQPATDFFGIDSFSFKADDGDATSNLATVTIHVTPTPGQDGLQRDNFVVFGQEGVILREAVKVMSGDVAASLSSQGPWLGDGAEVSIGEKVTFADATSKVMGDTLFLGEKAVVGNANYNELRGPGKVSGTKVTPQALPLLNRFVSLPAIGVGKQDVVVTSAGSATVAPGNYQSLKVGERGEVTFTGGVYSFKEWNVGEKTKLYFAGATEIRISGQALVGEYGYIGPAPSSAVTAKQIVIYVAGVNASIGNLGGLGAKAATFGPYATLAANVVVPNGTLLIRERSKAVGSFVGRWVSVGKFSELTLANRFSNSQIDGRVDSFVNLTLDDATGLNSTAPLSADAGAELLSEEGSNEEVPTSSQPSKIYLPVISTGGSVGDQSVNNEPLEQLEGDTGANAIDGANVIYLPTIVAN